MKHISDFAKRAAVTAIAAAMLCGAAAAVNVKTDGMGITVGALDYHDLGLDTYYYDEDESYDPTIEPIKYNVELNGLVYDLYKDHIVIQSYKGSDPELKIPSEIDGVPVTSITVYAFSKNKTITSVEIPESITFLGTGAFYDCKNLKDITFLERTELLDIDLNTFVGTAWLDAQPEGPLYVGDTLLTYLGNIPENTTVEIKEGTKLIADNAFSGREDLTSIALPDSLEYIGVDAFSECTELEEIGLNNGLVEIGGSAFMDCDKLQEIVIPDSVKVIGGTAFSACDSLESVTLPEGIETINYATFKYCESLKEITIPKSVKTIQDEAFSNCTALEEITVPEGVEGLGDLVFEFCTNLKEIHLPESLQSVGFYIVSNTAWDAAQPEGTIYLDGVLLMYHHETGDEECIIEDGTRVIASRAGDNLDVKSVVIPDSVKGISRFAFIDCPNLKSVTIPSSVTFIGGYAFGFVSTDNEEEGPFQERIPDFTIYGEAGSEAENYATVGGFDFVLTGTEQPSDDEPIEESSDVVSIPEPSAQDNSQVPQDVSTPSANDNAVQTGSEFPIAIAFAAVMSAVTAAVLVLKKRKTDFVIEELL